MKLLYFELCKSVSLNLQLKLFNYKHSNYLVYNKSECLFKSYIRVDHELFVLNKRIRMNNRGRQT